MAGGGARENRLRAWWNRARRSEWRVSTNLIGVLLILLGVGTAAQGYVLDSRTQRVAVCVSAYADGFADAIEARSQPLREAQDALDELMITVGAVISRTEGRDELVRAVRDYLRKRAEARESQERNPYPPAPREACEVP